MYIKEIKNDIFTREILVKGEKIGGISREVLVINYAYMRRIGYACRYEKEASSK